MARLIDDLMDVSRINQGRIELRRERVDLATRGRAGGGGEPAAASTNAATSWRCACPTAPIVLDADRDRGCRRCS